MILEFRWNLVIHLPSVYLEEGRMQADGMRDLRSAGTPGQNLTGAPARLVRAPGGGAEGGRR